MIAVILSNEIVKYERIPVEISLMHWVHGQANGTLNWAMPLVTRLGGGAGVLLIGLIITLICLHRRQAVDAVIVAAGLGGAIILNGILKIFFQRPRPQLWDWLVAESGFSFPSGHAMMSAALAISLLVLVWSSRWRWVALVLGVMYVGLVGVTRLYLGVHYPSDILAGWCISLIWVLLVTAVMRGEWPGFPRQLPRR